jgi:hypothetical protein
MGILKAQGVPRQGEFPVFGYDYKNGRSRQNSRLLA